MEGIYVVARSVERSWDPVSCPAGCWSGDSREVSPDAEGCYRCPSCAEPLLFVESLDDDPDWVVRIAE